MFCIRWVGIVLVFRQNNMLFELARILLSQRKKISIISDASCKSLGFSYDWDREIATSDPLITNGPNGYLPSFMKKGLLMKRKCMVNYCPALGTVLANEEVDNGKVQRRWASG